MDFKKNRGYKLKLSNYIIVMFIIGIMLLPLQPLIAGQVVLSSEDLPYTTVATNDTITFSASKITTTGEGITVVHTGTVIDLQEDTLEFGTGYGDDIWGIKVNVYPYNKIVKIIGDNSERGAGGLILGGSGTGSTDSSWGCCAIQSDSRDTLIITDVDVEMYGWDTRAIKIDDMTELTITGGKVTNHSAGFVSRCNFDASTIFLYNIDVAIIDDVIIDCWHDGIYFNGTSATISNCSILVDAKNDLYYPGDPWDMFCWTSALSAGITGYKPLKGSKIHDNVIVAGIVNEGCEQGIAINRGAGTFMEPIEIYNNTMTLHRGADDHYGAITVKGYKQRWANQYVYFYDNDITVYCNSDSMGVDSLGTFGPRGEGMDFAFSINTEGGLNDSFTVIERNHVEVIAMDAGCTTAGMRISIDKQDHATLYWCNGEWYLSEYRANVNGCTPSDYIWLPTRDTLYNFQTAGNIFRNNYFSSYSVGYDIGKPDGGQARYFKTTGDTVNGVASADYTYKTFEIGYEDDPYEYSSIGNVFKDLIYQGEAAYNDVDILGRGADYNDSGEVFIEKTLNIFVMGNNDSLIANAPCSVWNSYTNLVISGSSEGIGLVSGVVKYYHEIRDYPDSVYNPFTISVSKDGLSKDTSIIINWNTPLIYLELDMPGSIEAGGIVIDPPSDTIPPAKTDSLKAEFGAVYNPVDGSLDSSTILLSWIATGDDRKEGWADNYTIKYSTDSVIQSEWTYLETYSNPPTPDSSGRPESVIIDRLTPGQKYYIGLIATDEAENDSEIAETSGYARGILVPNFVANSLQVDAVTGEATIYSSVVNSYLDIYYEFQLATDSLFSNPITLAATNVSSSTASVTFDSLSNDVIYYCRSHAVALYQSEQSAWTVPLNFNLNGMVNTAPTTPIVYSPLKGDTVTSLTPTLAVSNSTDAESDVLTYNFELYDTTATNLLSSTTNVVEGNQTTNWSVPDRTLSNDTWYSWRARTYDGSLYSAWSAYSYFMVMSFSTEFVAEATEVVAYPAPVSFLNGEQITFSGLPNSSVELTILTVSGETILHKVGVLDTWKWNGNNAAGYKVASGIYLWYIQIDGTTYSGKIVNK